LAGTVNVPSPDAINVDSVVVADIGHYESEQFTPNLLNRILKRKFINFAPHLSEVSTNPINYF